MRVFIVYRERDSNPHGPFGPTDFKSVASTYSAIPASYVPVQGRTVLQGYFSSCNKLATPLLARNPGASEDPLASLAVRSAKPD